MRFLGASVVALLVLGASAAGCTTRLTEPSPPSSPVSALRAQGSLLGHPFSSGTPGVGSRTGGGGRAWGPESGSRGRSHLPSGGTTGLKEGTHASWLYEVLSPHVEEMVVAGVRRSRGRRATSWTRSACWSSPGSGRSNGRSTRSQASPGGSRDDGRPKRWAVGEAVPPPHGSNADLVGI